MGSSQSAADVNSNNDDDETIVGISEAVANRLLGKEEGVFKEQSDSTNVKEHIRPVSLESNSLYLSKREQIKVFENYYKQQLKSLEEQNKILKETSQTQFQAAVKEIEDKFPAPPRKDPLCKELQNVVMHCYQENKGFPLKCSHEVKSFIDCVYKQNQASKS